MCNLQNALDYSLQTMVYRQYFVITVYLPHRTEVQVVTKVSLKVI